VARENAVGDALTVSLLDSVVAALDRGSEELAGSKQHARRKRDAIVGIYDALEGFPADRRAEPPEAVEPRGS
jgi:hypothetical protein